MANTPPANHDSQPQIPGVKQVNLVKASSIMALGTITSRLLGFVRMALLIALIGAIGANDAFQAANNLPNTIYNLLASSVLSAVLVPQIVQALKRGDGDRFINRLLTLFTTGILLVTLVCLAIAPLLVMLFAAKLAPGWKALAITFSYWCLPQIMFYGLYSLWGQLLNAKGIFGPYMWSPVVNNLVGIAGLGVFLQVCGTNRDWANNPQVWTGFPIGILAGITTLGIVLQAAVLLWPLYRSGFRLRLEFGFRGQGLGNVSKTASWAFLGLLFSQIGFLAVSNIAAAANGYATAHGVVIATTTARATAFMVFFIPQSTIVVSVVTALFTSLSSLVAAGKLAQAGSLYLRTQEAVAVLTIFFGCAMFVLSTPIMQVIMPSSSYAEVSAYSGVLRAFCVGIPFIGFNSIAQRMALSVNDAVSLFVVQVPATFTLLAFCGVFYFFLPASWWVIGTSLGEMAGYLVAGILYHLRVHRRSIPLGNISASFGQYLRLISAGVVAASAATIILHWWGEYSGVDGGSVSGHVFGALTRGLILTIFMALIYLALLFVFRSTALAAILPVFWRKLPGNKPLPDWVKRYDQRQETDSSTDQKRKA